MGANVLVIENSNWVGGQATAAGVSSMDDMSRLRSGIYLEFINRLKNYYDMHNKSMATCYWSNKSTAFEPKIGQEVLLTMIADARRYGTLDIFYNSEIINVHKTGKKITGVTINKNNNSRKIDCKILIDATEYGDIIPLAKAKYRAGNSISPYINQNAMIQDITWVAVIKKYHGGIPDHLRPKNPMPGYEDDKKIFAGYISADGANFKNIYPVQLPLNFISHNAYRGMPDSSISWNYDASRANWKNITKTQLNWANDYPGISGWINGRKGLPVNYLENKKIRSDIEKAALIKTLNLIYYIQNELHEEWSVPDNEYNNKILPEVAKNFPREWQEIVLRMPPIPYVRESKRIIAEHTLTSHELLLNSLSYRDGKTSHEFSNSIAIGGYILDLHGANTDSDLENDLNERSALLDINRPRGQFQIPMDILIPEDVDGFIAAEKNLSMSRLTAGAMRLQPITMMTGQAAGALAAMCVKNNLRPNQMPALPVQWELLKSGVILSLCNYSDVPPENKINAAVQISNLYGLAEPEEYPHELPEEINFDNAVLAMATIKINSKGIFGADKLMTRAEAEKLLQTSRRVFRVINTGSYFENDPDKIISRGDFAKAVYEAFPLLSRAKIKTNAENYFILTKNKNSDYVEKLSKLGILEIYKTESEKNFHFGRPVKKGEAVDIIVRAAVVSAGV